MIACCKLDKHKNIFMYNKRQGFKFEDTYVSTMVRENRPVSIIIQILYDLS